MTRCAQAAIFAASIAFCGSAARAQLQSIPASPTAQPHPQTQSFGGTIAPPAPELVVIANAPYSAEERMTQTPSEPTNRRLPPGSRTRLLYRDSLGRTRRDQEMGPFSSDYKLLYVQDPVAGFTYSIDPQTQTVHRFPLRVLDAATIHQWQVDAEKRPDPPSQDRPVVSSEQLGRKMIAGADAVGRVIKTTYPVGLIGNDRPIITTQETWNSPDLKIQLYLRKWDPRLGEVINEIVKLDRSEPDAELFRVPPGFTIVDEAGSFRLSSSH